jgi:Zn finger protein HypA/HybF involved in hydrogenase expression
MRTLVEPPASLRCDHCHGALRLKQFAPEEGSVEFDIEVFVCSACGNEQSLRVVHGRYAPHHRPSGKVSASFD